MAAAQHSFGISWCQWNANCPILEHAYVNWTKLMGDLHLDIDNGPLIRVTVSKSFTGQDPKHYSGLWVIFHKKWIGMENYQHIKSTPRLLFLILLLE